jgi:hypothetical protein
MKIVIFVLTQPLWGLINRAPLSGICIIGRIGSVVCADQGLKILKGKISIME